MITQGYRFIEERIREYFKILGTLDAQNRRDIDAMVALLHDNVRWEFPYVEKPLTLNGKESLRAFWEKTQGISTEVRYDIVDLIVDETKQTGAIQVKATRKFVKTQMRYDNLYVYFFRFENGKFIHVAEYANPILAAPMNKAIGID